MSDPLQNLDLTRTIMDGCPEAIIALNPSCEVLFWSKGAEIIFGYPAEEAVGRPLYDLIVPPDSKDEMLQHFHLALSGTDAVYESFRTRKDGSLVFIDTSERLVEGPNGMGPMVVVAKKDITRLKVDRDFHLLESTYSSILESTPDAIVIVNRMGSIVLANTLTNKLFGYAANELIGTSIETLLPERFRKHHLHYRSKFFDDPRTRTMGSGIALFGIRQDGSEFPVEISLSPLETEEGMMVMSAIRDISVRKHQEELHRQSLEEINKRTVEANRLKSEFLSNMSHELRTPLNGVIGFSEFLLEGRPGPMNEKQQEYIGDILTSGKHLLRLINSVLDLAKVESGKIEFDAETFVVADAIMEVTSITSPIAQKKAITLSTEIDPSLGSVVLDQQKFKQVLFNLISNALKFTDGAGRVEVNATLGAPGFFVICVTDNGIGIRPEDMPRLFQEFQQLDSGPTRRFEGTGLGLALVKRLVEYQGGSITAESEFGKGSTFIAVLPTEFPNENISHGS